MRSPSFWNERAHGATYGTLGSDVQKATGVSAIRSLNRGLGLRSSTGPTLRSVRRMPNLMRALCEINRRPIGVDGIPWEAFVNPRAYALWNPHFLEEFGLKPLRNVQSRMAFGGIPDPAKEVRVKKRVVQCGTVANRIIERAIARKLQINLDRNFSNASWAYRPGRSAAEAIKQIRHCVRRGVQWALTTDISHFFDSIDRLILTEQLQDTIADEYLCELIIEVISPCVFCLDGEIRFQETGVPQGNGLSPILSNLHLHQFDVVCSSFWHCYRYADDILVLGHTKREVLKARDSIRRLLCLLGLKLNRQKTFIKDLHREPVVFLGFEIRGGNIYPPEERILRLERKLKIRGQPEERINLMKGFVNRYRVGPVRKLFRRVDQRLHRLYPPGVTLVGLLDTANASSADQRGRRPEEVGQGRGGHRARE